MSTERQCPRCGASVDVRASRCSACGSRAPKVQAARRGHVIPTFVDARTPDGPMKAILLPPAPRGRVHINVEGAHHLRSALARLKPELERAMRDAVSRSARQARRS